MAELQLPALSTLVDQAIKEAEFELSFRADDCECGVETHEYQQAECTLRDVRKAQDELDSIKSRTARVRLRARKAEVEVIILQAALCRYGDRAAMANCPDPSMQQVIDRAFQNAP